MNPNRLMPIGTIPILTLTYVVLVTFYLSFQAVPAKAAATNNRTVTALVNYFLWLLLIELR